MLIQDEDRETFFHPWKNYTIWRYMDFAKYVSLLDSKKLFFARADQFHDPYEGTWSVKGIRELRDPEHPLSLPESTVQDFIDISTRNRELMFISCWHINDHESAALWKVYLQSNEGVAIKSDCHALESALEHCNLEAGVSVVRYIDYDQVMLPFGNSYYPFLYKRTSFAHEAELRALIWAGLKHNRSLISEGASAVTIDVELGDLIKAVHVCPTAPRWFGDLVEQVTRRYELSAPVLRSNLYDRPSFEGA